MIEPAYLATLRSQIRAELVLTMVQLDHVIPGWWESQELLAADLGISRSVVNKNLNALARKGFIAHKVHARTAGTFVWWVKRSPTDQPDPTLAPAYVLRDMNRRMHERVPVYALRDWATRRCIPYPTFRGFLNGKQMILRDRWELVSTPYDLTLEVA